MRQDVFLTLAVTGVFVLTGCQQKSKKEDILDTETALQEITALTNAQTSSALPAGGSTASLAAMMPTAGGPPPGMAAGAVSFGMTTEKFVKPSVEEIQQALQNAGLYRGRVDGDLGPRTKKAIRDFQKQNGLVVDGKVGPKTWPKLQIYLNTPPLASSGN